MPIDGAVGVALADGAGAGAGDGAGAGAGDGELGGDGGSEIDLGNEGDGSGDGEGDGAGAGDEDQFEIDETTGEQKLDADGNPIKKAAVKADPKATFKKGYEALKEVDPAAAKAYHHDHFENQAYKTEFPTVADARAAKEAIENYGGLEGIEEINQSAQQYATEMEKFSQGDPQFIQQLAKDDPEGFARSAAVSMKVLGEVNKNAYNSTLAPIVHATLNSSGINSAIILAGNTISDVFAALKTAGNADPQTLFALNKAYDAIKGAYDYTENIKRIAEQSGEQPLTEREKKIQQREEQVDQKQQQAYTREVATTVTKTMDGLINTSLLTYFKQFPKLNKDQKADLHHGVFDYISRQLQSNSKYRTQLQALVNDGDVTKVNNFVSQNVKKIVQASAKTIWNRRGFGTLPNQKVAAAGGDKTGVVVLTHKPKSDDIDWTKTTQLDYMGVNGIATVTLKGSGRKVRFDWNKVQ